MSKGKPSSLTSIAFNTGVTLERERIIKLLIEEGILKPRTNENENDQQIIALIKREQTKEQKIARFRELSEGMPLGEHEPEGENKKGHNGGEHTPCCDDWDCYGCEDCDCLDCQKGESK